MSTYSFAFGRPHLAAGTPAIGARARRNPKFQARLTRKDTIPNSDLKQRNIRLVPTSSSGVGRRYQYWYKGKNVLTLLVLTEIIASTTYA
jgi:hypothetical protein